MAKRAKVKPSKDKKVFNDAIEKLSIVVEGDDGDLLIMEVEVYGEEE